MSKHLLLVCRSFCRFRHLGRVASLLDRVLAFHRHGGLKQVKSGVDQGSLRGDEGAQLNRSEDGRSPPAIVVERQNIHIYPNGRAQLIRGCGGEGHGRRKTGAEFSSDDEGAGTVEDSGIPKQGPE